MIVRFLISLGIVLSGFINSSLALEIEKIGFEKGLSNNNIVSIAQDNDGFLWFCTKDGLNKFDSNTFEVFKTSESDSNSICSNVLNFVYADKFEDIVWIATEKNGVDAYNYKTKVFTHYGHDNSGQNTNCLSSNGVTHIDGDDKGNLWFATYGAGINLLEKETGNFIHYNQSNVTGLGSNYNWCVMHDTHERIYVGHVSDGFSIINLKTQTAVNFKNDPDNACSLPDNTVTDIFKDSQENIWIGTRNGLTLFDPETYQMVNFKNNPNNPASLSNNFIQKILETNDNKIWIGTEGGGVNIVDLKHISFDINPSQTRFNRILASETPEGLSSLSVQSIFQDSFGNIWLGGLGGDINFIPHLKSNFNSITYLPIIGNTNSLNYKGVHGLCVDETNKVWVANGHGGLSVYDNNKKIKQINKIGDSPDSHYFLSVYKDSKDNIWLGTDRGKIFQYKSSSDTYKELDCFEDLENIPIYNFFEDSKNNLWISTDIGLYVYNITSQKCKIYTTDNSGLSDNIIRAIAEDGNGNIWVGTLIGGLNVFDDDFNLKINYGAMYDFYSVNHIYKDSKNRMWVGSQNDLFLMKSHTNDSIMRIGKISGLNETHIRAIIEGKTADEIWLSTINGLSHIDLNTMHVSNYDVYDDIVNGDYISGCVTKSQNGMIFFGSQNGITWFDQDFEQKNHPASKAVITDFSITNSKNFLHEFKSIPFDEKMVLKHNQNSFQVDFNALDYSLADKIEFVYQMQGLDDSWFLINKDKYVAFRNLKPGNYVFNVKARIHNTEWSDEYTSLTITVKPPLWATFWAILLYIFFGLIILYYIISFYKNKLKVVNDLVLEKKSRQQEHELNEAKLKFFTNITHELRTPMTLILGPLEDLISDTSLSSEQKKKLYSMQRVANRLLQMISQILEFRKSENNCRKLNVVKEDVIKYVNDIGIKYKDLNHKKDVEFLFDLPEGKLEIYFDPEVIDIILDNLLSNAFKYTKEGFVKLELKCHREFNIEYTEIIVSDSGYGISETDLPHIYERYYQAKNTTHPVNGTGIGLALVKNMVELHEAGIEVMSKLNSGTIFKVKFLTNNSYPNAIHYEPDEKISEELQSEDDSKPVILVVDDNQEVVEYIQDSLTDIYQVYTAENGMSGFESACEIIPDIIISDIMMPVLDGIEMTKQMKKDIRTSHIPVVLLTAKGSVHDQRMGYDAGADSYLTKPFSSNLLKSRLKNILELREKLSSGNSSRLKDKQVMLNESMSQLDKEFLEKLYSVIEGNLEDEEMNISQVAAQLNMSHSTLYRKIKALTNLTANEYIRKVRINYAEKLLLTNKYNISEIMDRIGINSSSYFRQCFKEEFGMNPSEYLKMLKEKVEITNGNLV